ncbi:MAG TPA: urease accessory UreF family protein, partial [Methanomicrobiales archaeon]|nr:urease accessory UreF family protein [Methanomicrobiales archaeon]
APEEILNLIRISDTFFPLGSFTVSQGMEQIVADGLFDRGRAAGIARAFLEKVWISFDLTFFSHALEAYRGHDLEALVRLDRLCHASKITEENRTAMAKTGRNLADAVSFGEGTLWGSYRDRIARGETPGMYPVVLAAVSAEMNLGEQGGLSLIYVNLMEVVASLVRMAEIDYLEAQQVMAGVIAGLRPAAGGVPDISQSFPAADIASMRHEESRSRMFIS